MFYCDKCREKNNWPYGAMLSYGKCEICGCICACYDVQSKHLIPITNKELRDKLC